MHSPWGEEWASLVSDHPDRGVLLEGFHDLTADGGFREPFDEQHGAARFTGEGDTVFSDGCQGFGCC